MRLVEAGLSTLRISIESLSSEEYKQHAGANIEFEKIVENIRYYYKHCGQSKIYVKIIDYMLNDDPEKIQLFHKTFKDISHMSAIEHLTPTIKEIDYSKFSGTSDFSLTQDGLKKQSINVCPQPFYMIQLIPDGSFVPCCSMKYPIILNENVNLINVWNSTELNKFRLSFLRNLKNSVCKECTLYQYGAYQEDVLDGHEPELIKKFFQLTLKTLKIKV